MSAADEIRQQLDELGVDYKEIEITASDHVIGYRFAINYEEKCGDYLTHIIVWGSCTCVEHCYLTPQEAIDLALNFWKSD